MTALPLPVPALEADGIRLREWVAADLPIALRATQDPAVTRFTRVPRDQTAAELQSFVNGHAIAREAGTGLDLAIADAATDRFLGAVGLVHVDAHDARAEIGYWLAPGARGRGVATAAVRLLAAWALTTLPLQRLELAISVANTPSLAVAERAGFVREALLRSYFTTEDGRTDAVMYRLLPADLAAKRH